MKENKAAIMSLTVKIVSDLFPGAFKVYLVYSVSIPDVFIFHLRTNTGG